MGRWVPPLEAIPTQQELVLDESRRCLRIEFIRAVREHFRHLLSIEGDEEIFNQRLRADFVRFNEAQRALRSLQEDNLET